MSYETLYLVLERSRKRPWRGVRIGKISKKRPVLARPSEQALVKLSISIPDKVLEPRVVHVQINEQDIVAPAVNVSAVPAQS